MENTKTSTLAILGAKWISFGIILQKICQVLVIIILARLLVPEDFGLVAIAMVMLNTLSRVKELGMSSALVRQVENVQEAANTFFFFNLFLSIIIYWAIFASAPYVTTFFDNSNAGSVLKVMTLLLIVGAASAVQQTLAIKELAFKKNSLITLCESTVSGIISVLMAVYGFGVWSLVYGPLIGTSLASILWWIFGDWRPTLHFSRKVTKDMLGFGSLLFGASALDRILIAINRIFIGRFLGVLSLGFYDLTSRIIYLPYNNIVLIGQRVALPAFCQIQEDTDQIKRWYLKMTTYSCLIMAPITMCFLFLPDYFIPVIYGEKWMSTIPLIKILAFYVFLMPFLYSWPVYVSTKRADILLKFTILRLSVTIPLLFFTAKISLSAVCSAEMICIICFAPLNLLIIKNLIKISRKQLVDLIKIPLTGSIVFAVTLWIFRYITSNFISKPSLVSLIVILVPALGAYLLTIYICHPEMFTELKRVILISTGQERVGSEN